MQKHSFYFTFLFSFTFVVIFCGSCGSDTKKTDETDSVKVQQTKAFSVGDYNFGILENTKFIPYDKAIYHRGDEVYMVLENVGPFSKGPDSLNHAEMKMEVVDAIGELVIRNDKLFGERGVKNFTDNTLKRPAAHYKSEINNKPGKYTMTVTIYDLLKKDSIVVSDDFFLE